MFRSCPFCIVMFTFSSLLAGASPGDAAATQSEDLRATDGALATSFEEAKTGPFTMLETALGTWKPDVGQAIVDGRHAKTGNHCLQLIGGEKTSLTLELAAVHPTGDLTFWAERWTRRSPFSFRIEKNTGTGWQEIFNGDDIVRVGRAFLSHVRVPLGEGEIRQLRFSVTSPPNTGILIDDVRLTPARPQEIVAVDAVPLTLPALIGVDASALVKLKIETVGSLEPISLTDLQAMLWCDEGDVESIQVYCNNDGERFTTAGPFGATRKIAVLTRERARGATMRNQVRITFTGRRTLAPGSNHVWVACKLADHANLDHRIGARCSQLSFDNGQSFKPDAPAAVQRIGLALRQGGDDGVHTYRIPGLTTTIKGTLVAVYDVRRRGAGDLPNDIDIGMSRSTDGGRIWEPMRVIMDMGDDPDWRYDGVGDPAVLVDHHTGTIWVAATWSHGNRSWRGSGPGLTPNETGQLMLVRSDDDGVSWSKPINITGQIKRPEWSFILQGPGKGITMRDGTLVFAAQYQDSPEQSRLPHSTIIFSKDHGATWHVGTGAWDDTTEAQVVEVEPGVLMLNCRYNRKPTRVVVTSRDFGETWQRHTTSARALIEPHACMASLIDAGAAAGNDAGGWLLFSNPDSQQDRRRLMIKASPDRGVTWPKDCRLLLDQDAGRGYSCLTMIDEHTVGILYEGSQADLTFQRMPLSDLVGAAEEPQPQPAVDTSLRVPRVFGDHMVLQAAAEIPVWGNAKPGARVTVTLGDESRTARTDGEGRWRVRLKPRKSCPTPTVLRIRSGDERIDVVDVLIGEVWVCAGQSNMEWPLAQSTHGTEELAAAERPNLRLLHLVPAARGSSGSYAAEQLSRLVPETFFTGQWSRASAESARDFSAVAWYFGRRLQRELEVPVGLICPAVGGTPTEAWIPRSALEADPALAGLVAGNWLDNERLGEFCRTRGEQNLLAAMQAGERIPGDDLGPNHSFKPGFMWSAGIEPLIPYAMRGVIWYQGESNADIPPRVREHGRLLPRLINQWRARWREQDFPFLFVQLPALNRPEWPWFRDGQRRLVGQLNNVGMAVTIDTGHPTNVHPPTKDIVGQRLAIWALGTTYRMPMDAYSGPLCKCAERSGNSILLSFSHVGRGLQSVDGHPPRHFEMCGPDGVFRPASARITGKNTVSVASRQVAEPCHVRYAWVPFPNPPVNLFNSADLPASPFSTETEETLLTRRQAGNSSFKLIKTLLVGQPDPATQRYLINGASNFRGSPTYEELETTSQRTRDIYKAWLNPPEYQLFDLQTDPCEFNNLADDPKFAVVKARLMQRLARWQQETHDRLADRKLLARLNAEVKQCLKQNIRVPIGGWKYVDYLAPNVGGQTPKTNAMPHQKEQP